VWPVVSWLGLAGCLALFVSLPLWALITGCALSPHSWAPAGSCGATSNAASSVRRGKHSAIAEDIMFHWLVVH